MQRTSRQSTVYPISVRGLTVLRVQEISPAMRRIVLGGEGLQEHQRNGVTVPAFRSEGFDDDVKIIVPDPATGLCPVPEPQPGGTVAWTEESVAQARTYTIRRFDAEAGEVSVDFVIHGTGLASSWAQRAQPGDTVYVAGPKASASLPDHTDWLLLAADETALPAVARCLESLPAGHRVKVFAEVAEPAHRFPLPSAAAVDLTWLSRSQGESLAEAVMDFDWWEGEPFVWVAGETLAIKPLRRWLKTERGVPRENTDISGYWRHREVAAVEGDPQTVDLAASGPSPEAALHELTEITPALAVRSAVSCGLFAALDEGAVSVAELSEAVAVPPEPLLRWLRLLASLEAVVLDSPEGSPQGASGRSSQEGRASASESALPGQAPLGAQSTVRLGALGELLSDPESRHARALDRAATLRELSLAGLPEAARTGGPVPVATGGRNWEQLIQEDSALREQHQQWVQEEAWFTAPAVPGALGLTEGEAVHFRGPGASVFAEQALGRLPGLVVTHDEDYGAPLEDPTGTGTSTAGSEAASAGTVVLLDPFGTLPPDRSREVLSGWVGACSRLVALSALVDEQSPDPYDLEEDLRRLCLTGGTVPTRMALSGLAADAGTMVRGIQPVGWGQWAVDLAPLTARQG